MASPDRDLPSLSFVSVPQLDLELDKEETCWAGREYC